MLQRLQGKLQAATTLVDGFLGEKEGRAYIITIPRRLRYAIYAKSSLGRMVEDLERWHREWDPSWIMIARIATSAIDKEITAQKAAKNQSVSIGDASRIRFSSAGISLNVEKATPVIVDRVPYHPESGLARATKDVRDLARVLSQVDPVTCSLLACLAGFVHKNISPENVLVMEQADTVLGKPFLVGFEKFRLADGQTYRSGDVLWEENLYRHPKRQGPQPEEDYVMQHDIYSLGVCLLEIGLWTSFVTYDSQMKDPTPGSGLDIMAQLSLKDQRKKAFEIERILVEMAKDRLPSHMGKKYTDVVISCLTCLDKNNSFGKEDEFMDEDGVEVGVRYIEKILQAIDGISV
ncbi:hypothetical protein B0A49_05343 [Cryomyces minteri]|uniref:Protein kinase domain-containing protein n=1 Tax=Cryomyces minteri TaxID=331657 RepID=A0A4U0X181_9PEZI|nr:hypothetical protein B0A49_05343 [Cryomyces minteri]